MFDLIEEKLTDIEKGGKPALKKEYKSVIIVLYWF